MRTIEIAKQNNWCYLWLELNSMLVVNAFKNHALVPWKLRNRWDNCLNMICSINFIVSHILREENQCADYLANIGLTLNVLTVWLELPFGIRGFFYTKPARNA